MVEERFCQGPVRPVDFTQEHGLRMHRVGTRILGKDESAKGSENGEELMS